MTGAIGVADLRDAPVGEDLNEVLERTIGREEAVFWNNGLEVCLVRDEDHVLVKVEAADAFRGEVGLHAFDEFGQAVVVDAQGILPLDRATALSVDALSGGVGEGEGAKEMPKAEKTPMPRLLSASPSPASSPTSPKNAFRSSEIPSSPTSASSPPISAPGASKSSASRTFPASSSPVSTPCLPNSPKSPSATASPFSSARWSR